MRKATKKDIVMEKVDMLQENPRVRPVNIELPDGTIDEGILLPKKFGEKDACSSWFPNSFKFIHAAKYGFRHTRTAFCRRCAAKKRVRSATPTYLRRCNADIHSTLCHVQFQHRISERQ